MGKELVLPTKAEDPYATFLDNHGNDSATWAQPNYEVYDILRRIQVSSTPDQREQQAP